VRHRYLLPAAAVVYLLSAGLHYVDALRFQYTVSPDYAFIFWLFIFPVSFLLLVLGWLALCSQKYWVRFYALIPMFAFDYYFQDPLPSPPGYPELTPLSVYWALFAAMFMLLILSKQVDWWGSRKGGSTKNG
jgi:hypothetical protein